MFISVDCLINVFRFLVLCDMKKCLFVCSEWSQIVIYCINKNICGGIEVKWNQAHQQMKCSITYPFVASFFDTTEWVHMNDFGTILMPIISKDLIGLQSVSVSGKSQFDGVEVQSHVFLHHWCETKKTYVFHMNSDTDYIFNCEHYPIVKITSQQNDFYLPRVNVSTEENTCWMCSLNFPDVSKVNLPAFQGYVLYNNVKYLFYPKNQSGFTPNICYDFDNKLAFGKYFFKQDDTIAMSKRNPRCRKYKMFFYPLLIIVPKTHQYLHSEGENFTLIIKEENDLFYWVESKGKLKITYDEFWPIESRINEFRILMINNFVCLGRPGLWGLFDPINQIVKTLTTNDNDLIPFYNSDVCRFEFLKCNESF